MSALLAGALSGDGGIFTLGARSSAPGSLARAYDSRGATLEWWPAQCTDAERFACDVEWRGRGVDDSVRALAPAGMDAFEFWIRAELSAKLTATPILEWLHRYRAGDAPLLPAGARAWVVHREEWTVGFARIDPATVEAE